MQSGKSGTYQGYFAIIIDQSPCFQILVKSLKNWCIKDLIFSLNNTIVTIPSNLASD